MKIPATAKRVIKQALNASYEALGVSHTRTKAQIQQMQAQITPEELERRRVSVITAVVGCDAEAVAGFVAAYEREPWVNISLHDAAQHNLYGIPLEDRLTLYALVWAHKPRLAVETGTASGMAATALLSWLVTEPEGRLYSIDLDDNRADAYGALIPQSYQPHFTLVLQGETPVLPTLLDDLGAIDLFYHDSVHTLAHMRWEYELAWPYIRKGGCLASHDIFYSTAFDDFTKKYAGEIAGVGKVGNFGFVIKAV